MGSKGDGPTQGLAEKLKDTTISDIPTGSKDSSSKSGNEVASASTLPSSAEGGGNSDLSPATMGPELPPALAPMRNKSAKEILDDLNKSPLFMTELEENDGIAALQALAYEGTPLENAIDFKERGNECFKERRWIDAKMFYTKGINVIAAEFKRRVRGDPPPADRPAPSGSSTADGSPPLHPDSPFQIAKENAVMESLYVNRAACQLHVRNYRNCTIDCEQALILNPNNLKAIFRCAKALCELDKVAEAGRACGRGLALDPNNASFTSLRVEIGERAQRLQARQKADEDRAAADKKRRLVLQATLRQRGYRLRTTQKPPEMEDATIQLLPDPDHPDGGGSGDSQQQDGSGGAGAGAGALAFPTVILYPADMQSDFIKAFSERDCMNVHLSYLLPLPWDKDSAYTQSGAQCYMASSKGALYKMGKKVPLEDMLRLDGIEIVDEIVRIYVLPKGKVAAKWAKEFKGFAKGYAQMEQAIMGVTAGGGVGAS